MLRRRSATARYFTNARHRDRARRGRRARALASCSARADAAFHLGHAARPRRRATPLRLTLVSPRRRAWSRNDVVAAARRRRRRRARSTASTRRRRPARRQPHDRSTTPSRTAPATSSTRASSTAGRAASSTARSSCARTRRRPTPSRPTRTCCCRDDAEIDTKPQLEIYADDVKCTHGATIGQLDEDALFYLRSRGIGETDGRGAADPRLRRRDHRADRDRAAARARSSAAPRAPASAESRDEQRQATMARRTQPRVAAHRCSTSTRLRADFPILAPAGARQAARLSRQRRHAPRSRAR